MIGPVLFLDIDGVVAHYAYAMQRDKTRGDSHFDPAAVKQLVRIVNETACSIILSSTWRIGPTRVLTSVHRRLIEAGMPRSIPLAGRTPYLQGSTRGAEVTAWLRNSGYRGRYCCVDDEDDGLRGHRHPLVQTDFKQGGLTPEHADRCIAILSGTTS